MQTDAKQRISFFDDDDLNINFTFKRPERPLPKDLETAPLIRENLSQHVVGSSNPPLQGSFALFHRTLVYYKTASGKAPEMYLELAHSRLNVAILNGTNQQYGFSLAKNGVTYEFYSHDKQIIDEWMNLLKNVCVLNTFHEEYKALKMIGRGSFAKVYLVESKTTGKMFAVKAFTKESVIISNKSNAKPSMINEIDLMRQLDHPHIIKLYEVYETEKSIYLVMELIQGKSLQDVLKKPIFKDEYSESKVMKMIYAILDALAYLASKGIMHRDLKPDNILVDKDGKIKIVDFGLATYIDLPEYIFKKCGTPGYIAPEVFKYDQKLPATFYDHRCDVFSAGGIFYYMLFCHPFFEGANASEILRLNRKFTTEFDAINTVKKEQKDFGSKINKDGLHLLLQLLEFDQHKRITAVSSLSHSYFSPLHVDSFHSIEVSPLNAAAKRNSVYMEHMMSMGHNSQIGSIGSPNNMRGDRFAEKDSLYLDMGRPDINGRVDTLNNGSNNNSILLHRADSNGSVTSKESGFSKSTSPDPRQQRKSFRVGGANNNTFLKAAIFKNMQKQNEESKEEMEGISRRRASEMLPAGWNVTSPIQHHNNHGGHSANRNNNDDNNSQNSSHSSVDSTNDICNENPQLHVNVEQMKTFSPEMKPSRIAHSPNRPNNRAIQLKK